MADASGAGLRPARRARRLVYVYDGDWPKGATRVVKEPRSLAAAGPEVHLVARNETRDPRVEQTGWMTVHRLPAFGPRLVNKAVNFPYFFNPFWILAIWRVARAVGADGILVADLPLGPTALWVGRWLGLPVYFDMVEVYPEFLRTLWQFEPMGWSDHLVRNPRVAEWLERRVLPRFEVVFVVSEESRQRAIALGVRPERLVILGNTPEHPEELAADRPVPPLLLPHRGRPVLLFVGTIIQDRGVLKAVEAMPRVLAAVPDALLVVVGDGPARAEAEAAARRLGVAEQVLFAGWRPHAELAAWYRHADIGLQPFLDGSHVRITLANKLFDYMAAGLPVAATDLPSTRRILMDADAGILLPVDDAPGFADGLIGLLRDPERRRRLGEHGRQAVADRYAWRHDEARLLAALEG